MIHLASINAQEKHNYIHVRYGRTVVQNQVFSNLLKNLAGLPATIVCGGTFFVTTLPAPTIEYSPIVTLASIVDPEPIEAPLFTKVVSTVQSASVCSMPSCDVALG